MESVDTLISTHEYFRDLNWKEKIKASDLKRVDVLILIFARHAYQKGIKECVLPGQFEFKIREEIFVIKRFNEDVVGQFMKIIGCLWSDCLHAPYKNKVLWASEGGPFMKAHGELRKKLIPREFFNSYLNIDEVCRYFRLSSNYCSLENKLESYTFSIEDWPVFNKNFSMCNFSDLHDKYLVKQDCDVQLVTKTKSHFCHREALFWNGGKYFVLLFGEIPEEDEECKIDCTEYEDCTIEAYLDFVYLWATGNVTDCFQDIEFKQIYKLAHKFEQEFLIEHTVSCVFNEAVDEDIEAIKELNDLHFHPYLYKLMQHLEFLKR